MDGRQACAGVKNAQRYRHQAAKSLEEADAASIQVQVCQASGISSDEQRLVIGQSGLSEESTVFVSSDLDGGGKKRKKKTYTKPKKIKHKRKKVKLAVLKFYKVDSNDKVTRLRRECPHEICGPGVFMAMHFNRYYCGKCHLAYLIKKGEENA